MLLAGALWLALSSVAIAIGGESGTLLLGISSNLLVFYGFYQGWVRQAQDEEELHEHEERDELRRRHDEERRHQLEREAGR